MLGPCWSIPPPANHATWLSPPLLLSYGFKKVIEIPETKTWSQKKMWTLLLEYMCIIFCVLRHRIQMLQIYEKIQPSFYFYLKRGYGCLLLPTNNQPIEVNTNTRPKKKMYAQLQLGPWTGSFYRNKRIDVTQILSKFCYFLVVCASHLFRFSRPRGKLSKT